MNQISLIVIFFLSANILRVLCQREIQPYGPKMCNLSCQSELCSEYIFDDVQLRCRLITASTQLGLQTYNENNTEVVGTALKRQLKHPDKTISTLARNTCPPVDVEKFLSFCSTGNLVEVTRLVCHGIVNVNCCDKQGNITGVMNAALFNKIDVYDFLVGQNCNLSAVDEDRNSVIHYACCGNSVDIIKKLINDHNVDIEQREATGRTPLMVAIETGAMEAFKFLTERGADVTAVDDEENSILHQAVIAFRKEFINFILSKKIVDIECKGRYGRTPLMTAVILNKIPLVKLLRDKGADVYKRDKYNNTLLHMACGGDEDMVKYFLSLNITDIESRGQSGRTPLMVAADYRNLRLVKFLKGRGAYVKTVDDYNNTILHIACRNGDNRLVEYVLSLNTIDIESKGEFGRTPLMVVVAAGSISTVDLLLAKGANETAVDDEGHNVFNIASERGALAMVKHLATLGSFKEAEKKKDRTGNTPLAIGQSAGDYSDVNFLR